MRLGSPHWVAGAMLCLAGKGMPVMGKYRYLGPLVRKYGAKVQVRFCDFNTPFGLTIVDQREMVLSLNVYGLARSKNQTPCLIIENKYDADSVFKLYEDSFDAIWQKLDDRFPPEVAKHFETDEHKEVKTV